MKKPPKFIRKIDFELLRTQKLCLINLINDNTTIDNPDKDLLEGVVSLIDNIQDYAVDKMKYTKKEVFGDFDFD